MSPTRTTSTTPPTSAPHTHPTPPTSCHKAMETPKSSSSSSMEADGSTTPRPSRNERNFDALLDIPPPPYNGHGHDHGTSTETSSLLSYDSFYGDPRPQIRHISPSPDYDSQFTGDDGGSVATVRRYSSQSASTRSGASEGGWRGIDVNEWLPCISVWLLTVMVVMVVAGAAAVMYLLVTQ